MLKVLFNRLERTLLKHQRCFVDYIDAEQEESSSMSLEDIDPEIP